MLTRLDSNVAAISSIVTDRSTASALPSLSSLTANSYLSSSLGSLGTSFTPSGLPAPAPGSKSVAQRRAVAPPLVVGELRKVDDKEFEPYLNAVAGEYQRWQRENELGRQGTADLSLEGEGIVGLGLGVSVGQGAGRRGVAEEALPALEAVPQIFFDPNFNLGNPRTFDLVTERIQLDQPASTRSTLAPSATAPSPALSARMSPTLDSITTKMNRPSSPSDSDTLPGLGPLTLADLAADQILQEKLSHYTAIIESHLVREIGLRSSSFFSALSNLQSLHAQGEDCLQKIAELQSALDSDGRGVGGAATRGLKVLRAQARRRGLEKIGDGLRVVQEVQEGVEGVKELVEAGEWVGALEVSEQIEQLFYRGSANSPNDTQPSTSTSTSSPLVSFTASSDATAANKPKPNSTAINLTKIKALNHVPKKLAALRAQVATALEGELIGALSRELDEGVAEYVQLEGKWKGKGKEVIHDDDSGRSRARERAKERIRPGIRGLVRADGMDKAVAAWREAVLREIRTRVREHLPTSDVPTQEEEDVFARMADRKASVDLTSISDKSLNLAKNLRALSPADFLALARATYLNLLGCVEVIELHAEVITELATELREEERLRKARKRGAVSDITDSTPVERPPRSSSLNVPGVTSDHLNGSTETLALRSVPSSPGSEDGSALLIDISDVVHAAAELANVRFSKVIGVRGEIHARLSLADFVDVFEATWSFVVGCEVVCKRMIVGLRGVIVGQAKAFLQAFHQDKVTTSAKVVEEEQWSPADVPQSAQEVVRLIAAAALADPAELLLGERRLAEPSQTDGSTGPSSKQLSIAGADYFAVPAVLVTLDVLVEYLKVVVNLPLLTTDLMSKVIEFLKAFNSRTCQVVLGAGAMRSAGLKNITAKHLALASQALSVMISLIPALRETLRRHLAAKQAVMLVEFDRLRRDFQEHQHEIHAKLVAIMADRLDVHCKAFQAVEWEKEGREGAGKGPSGYVEALTKEHATLNKVISRYLQQATVEGIMGQVCANLDARLKDEFGRVEVKSDRAKERLKVDATQLRSRLIELNGVEKANPLAELEAIVDGKVVPEPAPPPISRNPSMTALRSPSVTSLASPQLDSSAALHSSPRASLDVPRTSSDAPRPADAPAPQPVQAAAPAPAPTPAPLARKKTMSERLAEIARRNRPGKAAPVVAVVREEAAVERGPQVEAAVTEVEGRTLPPPPSATPDESQQRPAAAASGVVPVVKVEAELPAVPAAAVVDAAEATPTSTAEAAPAETPEIVAGEISAAAPLDEAATDGLGTIVEANADGEEGLSDREAVAERAEPVGIQPEGEEEAARENAGIADEAAGAEASAVADTLSAAAAEADGLTDEVRPTSEVGADTAELAEASESAGHVPGPSTATDEAPASAIADRGTIPTGFTSSASGTGTEDAATVEGLDVAAASGDKSSAAKPHAAEGEAPADEPVATETPPRESLAAESAAADPDAEPDAESDATEFHTTEPIIAKTLATEAATPSDEKVLAAADLEVGGADESVAGADADEAELAAADALIAEGEQGGLLADAEEVEVGDVEAEEEEGSFL